MSGPPPDEMEHVASAQRARQRSARGARTLGALATMLAAGCATGAVREARVGPLGRYPEARGIVVEPARPPSSPLDAGVLAGAQRSLDEKLGAPAPDGAHLTLRMAVLTAESQSALGGMAGGLMSKARSLTGLSGVGASGAAAGRLEVAGWLIAPDNREVGYVRWEHEGAPEALAGDGGAEAALAIARMVPERRREFVARRAADERLLLTPTAQTLAPGEIVFSDDELLLVRLAAGVARRVQLDLWAGGFPIPGAGAFGLAGHGLIAVGGAGVAVLAFVDLGFKVRVLDETAYRPGIALSYDMLDLFGLGGAAGGVVVAADGAGGAGFGVVGGANAQFNLFSLVAGKHFGPFQLTAGSYLLDNHHYLPQSAAFQASCVAGATDGSSSTGGVAPNCANGSATLPRLPWQVQPFVGSELVLGPHSALMMEALLEPHIENTMLTTGARWLLGWSHPRGPIALDRIRFRIDFAFLWLYSPAQQNGMMSSGAKVLPLPWLGLGVYFL